MQWWRSWPPASRSWPKSSQPSILRVRPRPRLRSARLAARAAARQLSSRRQGRRQLRFRSGLGRAGGRFGRRGGNSGSRRDKIAKSRERVSVRPVRSRGSRCASVSRSLRMGERRTAIGPASVALIPSRDAASWNRQMIGSGDDPGVALPPPVPKHPHHEPERDSHGNQRERYGVKLHFHGDEPSFRLPDAGSPKTAPRLGKLDDSRGLPFP